MSGDIVIVGHGGLAREVSFLLEEINRAGATWRVRGFITSRAEHLGKEVGRHTVFETDDWLLRCGEPIACVIGIGDSRVVAGLYSKFSTNQKISFPNLIHPAVTGDWRRIVLGEGNIILNGASFTTDIRIGSFNIINPACTVSHDCRLGNNTLLGPGTQLGGEVRIGDRVILGVGARVLPGLSIADDVIVGAGAVVVGDITRRGTYAGVPARELRKNR